MITLALLKMIVAFGSASPPALQPAPPPPANPPTMGDPSTTAAAQAAGAKMAGSFAGATQNPDGTAINQSPATTNKQTLIGS